MIRLSISSSLVILLVMLVTACQSGKAQGVRQVNGEELKSLLQEEEVQLLDVRTPEEVAFGVIEGALVIDFYDPEFDSKLEELNKDQPIAVYCAAGGRSAKTANKLKETGFNVIYDLKGGMRGWIAEGRPVSKVKQR
ncbi:rhodanese-like domain-containing protein [Marinoscillum sp. MHG1-6]|uniref:rhodanese-like domain-containing protein n=1 Tax=Marinoscillum sp. MHG1-6 TaxID=2959627 RepID=UPI0021578825|nr:rhodanese-like domain-containing protein [Marinoscillum sp. MHG1-6]